MKNKFYKKALYFSFFLMIVAVLLLILTTKLEKPLPAYSSPDATSIRGWLWSRGTEGTAEFGAGWVSLNCYNFYGGNELKNCCPGGSCIQGINPSTVNYGLNINDDETISGKTWSSNLGWVCFGQSCSGLPPDGGNSWACSGNRTQNGNCLGDCGEDFNLEDNSNCTETPNQTLFFSKMNWDERRVNCNKLPGGDPKDKKCVLALEAPQGGSMYLRSVNVPDRCENSDQCHAEQNRRATLGWQNKAILFESEKKDWVQTEVSNPRSEFIIEGWTYLTDENHRGTLYGQQGNVLMLIGKEEEKDFKFSIWLHGNEYSIEGTTASNLNQWFHWAFVVRQKEGSKRLEAYRNGELCRGGFEDCDGSILEIETTAPVNLQGHIGTDNGADGTYFFQGKIDNLAVWSRAKSPEEIWDDAHHEISGWAKIEKWENEGWIKLKGLTQDNQVDGLYLEDLPNQEYLMRGFAWQNTQEPKLGLGWLGGWNLCQGQQPGEIKNFQAAAFNCQTVNLTWIHSVCAQEYEFYRANNISNLQDCVNASYNLIDTKPAADLCSTGQCAWTDPTQLTPNKGYCYKIKAINKDLSKWSDPVWVATPPCKPQDFTLNGKICGKITASWLPPQVGSAEGYYLYKAFDTTSCVPNPTPPPRLSCPIPEEKIVGNCPNPDPNGRCTYEDKKIISNKQYYYWITAYGTFAGREVESEPADGCPKSAKTICLPPVKWKER